MSCTAHAVACVSFFVLYGWVQLAIKYNRFDGRGRYIFYNDIRSSSWFTWGMFLFCYAYNCLQHTMASIVSLAVVAFLSSHHTGISTLLLIDISTYTLIMYWFVLDIELYPCSLVAGYIVVTLLVVVVCILPVCRAKPANYFE